MKKAHLSQISIDIKKKLLKYYRYVILFSLSIYLNNCENPQSPSWQTQISLPLIASQFSFSEMIDSEGVNINDQGLINIEYNDPALFPDDNAFELDGFFEIPGFSSDGYQSLPGTIPNIPSIIIPENIISISEFFNDFPEEFCVPETQIINALKSVQANPINSPIDFGDIEETLDSFFDEWNYITIGNANLNLNENIDLFFPTLFTYQVIGFDNDILFNNSNFNESGLNRIYDNIIFTFDLSYDFNNDSNEFSECTGMVPLDGDPLNLVEYKGWEYNPSKTTITTGGDDSSFIIESIESINGTTKEQIISNPSSIPVSDPSMPFGILGGVVSDDTNGVNSIDFEIINNSSFPEVIDFSLKLPNFKKKNQITGEYTDLFEINQSVLNDGIAYNVGKDGYLSNSKFQFYAGCNELTKKECVFNNNCELTENNICTEIISGIDSIYVDVEFIIPSMTGDIDLSNTSDFSISSININPINLSEINTIIHDFEIDVAAFTMPTPPEGSNIEGLQIVDPRLEITIGNEIADIDNLLMLDLKSFSDGDSIIFTIEADLGYGDNIINIEGSDCTNSLNDGSCNTYNANGESYPIADFLQSSPDSLAFSGTATLNGSGSFKANDSFSISGGLGLELPFSFILGTQINDTTFSDLYIIPEVSTQLTPVDNETYESVNNSLEEAALISNITNFSPLAGEISMIISTDNTFFPSYLDSIININNNEFDYSHCDTICRFINDGSSSALNSKLLSGIVDSIDYINQIDSIDFTPISSSDFRVKSLKFIYGPKESDYLLIARLAMLQLPCPIIDSNGFVSEDGEGEYLNYYSTIDNDQIGLINFTIDDKPRYLNTMMTLTNSFYPECPVPNQNSEGIINLMGIHYIDIESYASFKINLGEY